MTSPVIVAHKISSPDHNPDLNNTWKAFEQKTYQEMLDFLKPHKNNMGVLNFVRDQLHKLLEKENSVSPKPAQSVDSKEMLDALLVVTKLSRETNFWKTKLRLSVKDQKSLDYIKNLLFLDLNKKPDSTQFAKETLKRIASLRTESAKQLLKDIALDIARDKALGILLLHLKMISLNT